MKRAAPIQRGRIGRHVARNMQDRIGQIRRKCRAPVLVGHDIDGVLLLRQPQHGLYEVAAELTMDPPRADDDMVLMRLGNRLLSSKL